MYPCVTALCSKYFGVSARRPGLSKIMCTSSLSLKKCDVTCLLSRKVAYYAKVLWLPSSVVLNKNILSLSGLLSLFVASTVNLESKTFRSMDLHQLGN